jgi:hypothetical protein
LFHYGTYDASFTHVYSALFCALLITLAIREHRRGRAIPLSALFLSAFFLVTIRNTNVFLMTGLISAYAWRHRLLLTRRVWLRLASAAAGVGSALALQLGYNYFSQRTFVVSSYGAETFLWDRPMQGAVLVSYERGLLCYQPLFGLAVLSGLAVRAARSWTWLLLGLIGAYVVLYGYWDSWMLGGGMGHRGFVELAPLVAVVLGVAWNRLHAAPLLLATILGSLCTLVTLCVMIGYWNGTFPFGGATPFDYWTHVIGFDPNAAPPPPPAASGHKHRRKH